jgi:hypothetical protein
MRRAGLTKAEIRRAGGAEGTVSYLRATWTPSCRRRAERNQPFGISP